MKNVSILALENSVIEAIADPRYMFNAVNMFLQSTGKPALFDVQVVGSKKEIKLENSLFSVYPDKQIGEIDKTDLIFIPALSGDEKSNRIKSRPCPLDRKSILSRRGSSVLVRRSFFAGKYGPVERKKMFNALGIL